MGFDFIAIAPSNSLVVSSLSLDVGYLFWYVSVFLFFFVNGCLTVSSDFGVFMR